MQLKFAYTRIWSRHGFDDHLPSLLMPRLTLPPALALVLSLQIVVLLSLSSPLVFCLTVMRFHSADLKFPMTITTLIFALSGDDSWCAGQHSNLGGPGRGVWGWQQCKSGEL